VVIKADSGDSWIQDPKDHAEGEKSRYDRVLNKLRMARRNTEEKTSLGEVCFDYHGVFFLPGPSQLYQCGETYSSPRTRNHPDKYASILPTRGSKEKIDRGATNLLEVGVVV